ncbi:hypothetical protein CC1G_15348 [Coprinopsis cinerea okayama7|uniref:Meiotically up-regulated protein Msb1/Mug8 domain-containing protein n=1 Tax=Coprinopsis cinerea (strain Okayama-7 / 130 / ATCC MYA-4618 / FGSC 9003) TaxID=240176 RepID=D6RQ27_COPC7|nr:hypothetical protein CC1G_15348 [Coprinopsis cinerea okayama7\|eukprot:XP_002910441.1 hypothetical protein CC1G_15348 [Coprinopsis cinerea okayama7\
MSSFFSKVLRRKRDDREGSSPSEGELLGGKFEDVSPNVSPSAVNFPELMTNGPIRGRERARSTDKDRTLRTLFRSRSRAASPTRSPRRREETPPLPQLSLNFFNDPTYEPVSPLDDSQLLLSESTIGARRLTPVEALDLIRACSEAIAFRGIDSLGIMTPHWYSASPDIQRRLISLFIHSLTSQSPLSAIPSFESEINSTRSPHDVAAVLRWGLRHLQLEGDTFGNHPQWYNTFFAAERMADHPPKAFSETLAPLIPPTHFNLLKQVLEIFSSFTIYSDTNSTSGSKLSKVFGLWLLNAHRVETNDDWQTFYDRWERTGRQLEHLFFAQIRDEGAHHRAPLRLLQLVTRYPYYQDPSPATDLQLLPRPTFTTRLFDALLVRVMTELPNEGLRPKSNVHPLRVVAEALSASSSEGELGSVWAKIVATSKVEGTGTPLARIFSDETIRLLALVPDEEETDQSIRSPTVALLPLSPISPRGKRRSFSLSEFTTGLQRSTSTQSQSTDEAPTTAITEDWSVFSSAGFSATSPYTPLASTLFGTDIERTSPPPPSRRPSRHGRSPSTTSIPRKSVDFHPETRETKGPAQAADHHVELQSRIASVQIVQLDEAFVDFWSDALLDPITSNWPSFVVCRIRPSLVPELSYGEEGKQKTVEWVVLEQAFTVKPPPSPTSVPLPPTPTQEPQERPVSPSSMSKKRFAFWSTSRSSSFSSVVSSTRGKKDKERALRVSEMGEVLEEGDNGDEQGSAPLSRASTSAARRDRERKRDSVVRVRVPSPKPRKSTDVPRKSIDAGIAASKAKDEESKVPVVAAAATAAAIGGVATAIALATSSEEKHGDPEVVEETKEETKEDEEGSKGVAEEGAQGEPKSIFTEKFSSEEVTPEADVDSKVEEPPAVSVEVVAEPKEPEAPATRSLDVVEEEPVQEMNPAVPVDHASQEPEVVKAGTSEGPSVVEETASPAAVTEVKEETPPAAPTEFETEPHESGTTATRALVAEEKVHVEEQQSPLPAEEVVQDTQVAPPAGEEPVTVEEATIPTAVEEVVEEDAILAPVEPTDEPEVEQVASVVSSDGAIATPGQADEPILPATSTSEADAAPAVPLSQDDTPVDAAEAQGPQEDEHQEDISPNVADESQDPDPVQHSPTIEGPSSPQNPVPDAAAPDVHATTVVDDESTPTTPDETQEAEIEVETPVDVQAADGVLPPSVSTEETAPAEEVVPSVAAQGEVEPQPEEASVVPEPSTIVEDDGVPLRANEEPEHAQPSTVEEDRAILEPTEPTEEAHAPAEPIEDAADDTQDVPVPGVSLEDQEPTVEAEQSAPAVDENAQPIEASAIDLADDQASDSNVEPVAATLQEEPSVVEPEVEVQEEEAVVSVVEESADDQPKEEAGDAVLEAGQEESTEEAELKTEETSQDQPAAEAQMAETSDEVLEPSATIESAEVAIIVEDVLPTEELPQTTASPEDDAKAELETTVPLAEPVDDVTPVACELDVEAKEEADVPSSVSQDEDKDGAPAIEAVAEPEEKGVSGKEEAIVAAPAESPDDSSADQVAADTEGSPDAGPSEEPSTVEGVSPVPEDVRPATPTVDEELKVEQASPVTGATEGLTEATADVGVESKDEMPSVDPITEPSGGEQAKEETVQAIVEAEDDVEAKVVEEGEEVATEVPVVSDDEGKVEVPDVEPEVELKEEPVVEHAAEASIDEDSLAATESAPAPQDSVEQAAEPTEESCRSSPSPDPQEGPAAEVTAPSIEDVEPVTTTVEETSKSEEETSSVTEVVEDSPQEPLQEDEAPVEAEEQPAAEAIIAGPDTDVAPNDEVADSTTVEDQVEAEAQVEEVESSVPVEEPPAVEGKCNA